LSTELTVVQRLSGEILGPESAFTVARTEKRKEWAPIVESAKTITVTDAASKELAVGHGRLLQASIKGLTDLYTHTKRAIDAIKDPVLAAEKEDVGAINAAKDALGTKVLAYNREQDRIQAENNRLAQEAARKQAEEDRLQEAIALAALGEKEESEQILNEPVIPAPAIVQESNVKVQGEVSTQRYTAVVTDLKLLVDAVAAGTVPLQAVLANESFIKNQAKQFREGLQYPGVKVAPIDKLHFRA
jgi:hypothetical protein